MTEEYDYIIAGAGSAGCTLAARLCEDPSVSVLLVEAGGNGRSLFVDMPAGNGFIFGNPKFDWGFESLPQPGLNGNRIYYPRGRGVGGTSLMNGMVYIRGNPIDYDRWSQAGITGWSYAELLPYFKRSSSVPHRSGDPYHGARGPLKITPALNYSLARLQRIDRALWIGLRYLLFGKGPAAAPFWGAALFHALNGGRPAVAASTSGAARSAPVGL